MNLLEKFAPNKKKKKTPGINQCGEKGGGGVLHTHQFCVFEKFRPPEKGERKKNPLGNAI
jgi:hypothetical protein